MQEHDPTQNPRAALCRQKLEEYFPRPTNNPLMQALFDAVLVWMIEKQEHDEPK